MGGSEKRIERRVPRFYGSSERDFARAMGTLLGPSIVPGNRVEVLHNGDEIFPAMLEAIEGARVSITFETFIYWSGEIGAQFARALAARARAGVAVHILLDWVGSRSFEDSLFEEMREAGAEINRYHPLHWYHLGRLNNRTHRKVLVVDGRIGFTGGVGIAPQWTGHAQNADHWRDMHFRVQGPVVAQMQAVFLDNWIKSTGHVLHGAAYFPELEAAGECGAQMFSSSPSGGSESMHLMYLLSITAAEARLDLSISYFVPDSLTIRALVEAAGRGVKVRIIVPGRRIDQWVVRNASRALWGPMLRAGIEIHEFVPTMFHCKAMVVDDRMVSVGSTNFDNRSFRLNDEANLNVYHAGFAQIMRAVFEDDLKRSREITYARWKRRPLRERLQGVFSRMLSSQL
ncbi:MAG: cardiolipin synthase [Proteobacteria bacterium]|nr:cardiolipin synthase [Burkholderiales bacterium]